MEYPPEGRAPISDNPPNAPAPIPIRSHVRWNPLSIAFLGLIVLSGLSLSSVWLSHARPGVEPGPYRVPTPVATTTSVGGLGTPGPLYCVGGTLSVMGSNTLQPLVSAVAKDYMAKCPSATITAQGGGSSLGLTALAERKVDMAASDGFISVPPDFVDNPVTIAISGVIVNQDTGVTNLTVAQLQGIYAGLYTNWSQLGGTNLPIIVVPVPVTNGARLTFERYVLGQRERVSGPMSYPSDASPIFPSGKLVAATPGAIGYTPLVQLPDQQAGIRILSIDSNQPTAANVEAGTYPFWNIEHMYTRGQPTPLEQMVLDFIASSDGRGKQDMLHFVDMADMPERVIVAHKAVPPPARV